MQMFISISAVSVMSAILAMTNPPPPDVIELGGTVRDFKERTGGCGGDGHPDFEVCPSKGFGQYCKNISTKFSEKNRKKKIENIFNKIF